MNRYREVLESTSGHRRSYNEDSPVNSGKDKKYKAIISKLFPPQSARKRGSGLFVPHDKRWLERVFVYWNDANELVERLALLEASKSAGHTGHDQEILSIVEELREGGFIV